LLRRSAMGWSLFWLALLFVATKKEASLGLRVKAGVILCCGPAVTPLMGICHPMLCCNRSR
jgi:hypothetical protein